MKKLLFILGMMISSSLIADTQVLLPIVCLSKKDLIDTLKDFEEKPIIMGFSSRLDEKKSAELFELIIFMNPDTKSFTIVEIHGNDKFCAITAGVGLKPAPVTDKNGRSGI